jgi:hypothetical protein
MVFRESGGHNALGIRDADRFHAGYGHKHLLIYNVLAYNEWHDQ